MLGSTDRKEQQARDREAKRELNQEEIELLSRAERRSVKGLFNEVEILRQRLDQAYKKIDRIHGAMANFRQEIDTLKRLRVAELQSRGGGPTASGTNN